MSIRSGRQPIILILAATNPALGIGKNGSLPWRLKKEMKFFKEVTQGSTVVMGRKTWESIPTKFRPLANRTNIVVSRNANNTYTDGVIGVTSLDEAFKKADQAKPVFVIGGAQIYNESLPYADRILLTLVEDEDRKIECDTFFKFDKTIWQKQPGSRLKDLVNSMTDLPDDLDKHIEENGMRYMFTLWERQGQH